MTARDDLIANLINWSKRPDLDQVVFDGFMRSAESYISREMRVKEMIQIADAIFTTGRAKLPADWVELDYVRFNDGPPLELKARSDFFAKRPTMFNAYTIVGDYIYVGGNWEALDGLPIEISYYKRVPHLINDPEDRDYTTWLYEYYYDIYLHASLLSVFLYGLENDRAVAQEAYVNGLITSANNNHTIQKNSGSQLKRNIAQMRIG